MDDVVQPLPAFSEADGQWTMDGEVKDGHIYELAFDGSDAHAEVIERTTGLLVPWRCNRSLRCRATLPHDGRDDDSTGLVGEVLLSFSNGHHRTAVHAVLALRGRQFAAVAAGNVGVEFEHGLLLDHHPGDPRIGDGQQEKEPHNGAVAEVQELYAEGEGEEDAGREDIDGPFESHVFTPSSHSKGRGVDVHVPVLHHLPHLLVQLAVAAHALHHLA